MRFAYAQDDVKVNLRGNEDLTFSEYYYLMIAVVIAAQISSQAVLEKVATTPDAIGYDGIDYVEGASRVKSVSVDGVKASAATVSDKSYKIARPIYMFTRGNPSAPVVEFVDFVLGPEGQAFVKEAKLVPVPQKQ